MSNMNKEIMDWLNDQPHWVQLAATKVFSQEEIKDDLIDELLALLKTKEGQSKDKKVDSSGIVKVAFAKTNDVRILSVGDIEGIDALAPRCPLPFAHALSVIYGSNG
jgi:hypothetical protein